MKIGSFLLAVMMIFTAVFAAGCTPISLNQEWSYKTASQELPIGVYIYSLDLAYSQAQSYAEDQLDDYTTESDAWLDEEITDDDDTTEVARTWIKNQAELMCLSYLVIDEQITAEGAEVSTDDIAAADEQAETYWNVGQYADYGYIMPMSDDLEPYGISLDSFKYCTTEYSVKYSALFSKVYGEGGSKEVTDSELTDFFTENYIDYSYITVNLYESTTDEAGDSSNVALSDDDAKKLTDEFDGYAKSLNAGDAYSDVIEKYMTANELDTDPTVSNVENIDSSSLGDELIEALKSLDSNKATTLTVGEGDSAIYYLIYKNNINDDVDDYVGSETNKSSVLSSMKSEEFSDYIKDLTKELDYEANTSVLEKYDPNMFFVKVESTTAAEEDSEDEE
jgi:hypothetical protein